MSDDRRIIQPGAQAEIPKGFKTNEAGLIVPSTLERVQEVWTNDEWNIVEKAAKLAVQKGMIFRLFCLHPSCRDGDNVALVEMAQGESGRVLRCPHSDRSLANVDLSRARRIAEAASRRDRRNLKRKLEAQVQERRNVNDAGGEAETKDPGA